MRRELELKLIEHGDGWFDLLWRLRSAETIATPPSNTDKTHKHFMKSPNCMIRSIARRTRISPELFAT
jgi:hypothetical protein